MPRIRHRPSQPRPRRTDPDAAVAFPAHEPRIEVSAALGPRYEEILTPEALDFLAAAARPLRRRPRTTGSPPACDDRVDDRRTGATRASCAETAHIREDPTLARRRRRARPRGPPRRDHRPDRPQDDDQRAELRREGLARRPGGRDEPHLGRTSIGGQLTLLDAIRGELDFTSPRGQGVPRHARRRRHPTIVMRPRGWHLVEKHLRFIDRAGPPMAASGSLVDFGLYFFHNATGADRRAAAARTSTCRSSSRT